MISMFREFARSRLAQALLVLVALSLLVTGGISMDVLGQLSPKHVITAGARSVDSQEFSRDVDRMRQNMQEQTGQAVTNDQLAERGIIDQLLQERSQMLGFYAWAYRAGIRPGQALVVKEIQRIPAFFNAVTGKFDENNYRQALSQANITPERMEQDVRDDYMTQHYAAAVQAGMRLPRIYGALVGAQALETREGRYFNVTQAMAGTAGQPTDAQLTALLNQSAEELRRPELRQVSVVLFNGPGQIAPITEEQINQRFAFRRDALSNPEKRSFAVITAADQAAAGRIAEALRGGQSPEAAAAAGGGQVTPFTDTPRSAVSDPAVAEAVFGLSQGGVSNPVRARLGFAVVKVTSITAGSPVTLADVRSQIVSELQAEGQRQLVYDRVEAYEAARTSGKSMNEAAEAAGARVVQLAPFTREGRMADGQTLPAPPQLLETAFGLARGGESEVIDAGQSQYFVVRLDELTPARLPELNDIRDMLTRAWIGRENQRLLTEKAELLAGRIRAGENIEVVARSVGASVSATGPVQRTNQARLEQLGQGVVAGLFGNRREAAFTGPVSQDRFVVGQVAEIRPAVPAAAAPVGLQAASGMNPQSAQMLAQQSIIEAAAEIGSSYDRSRAWQALGLTTPQAPGTPGAPAAGGAPGTPPPAK